jgi:hypothetical protein
MHLRIGTGLDPGAGEAVGAAARAALAGCSAPAIALVYSTFDYPPSEVAAAVNRELGAVPWAGMRTRAILRDRELVKRGIAIGIIDSDQIRVRVGVGGPLSADARAAGSSAARNALADMPLPPPNRSRAMILLSDVTGGDPSEAVHGAVDVAGAGIAWTGGGAAGGEGDPRGVLFAKGCALHDHVVAIALDGHGRLGAGVRHGWQPTGAPAMVTRAKGPVIERLEHRPAIDIYRATAGAEQAMNGDAFIPFATTHPLGIPQADGEYLIRDPLSVDASGAIHFVAGIHDGALVRVMDGTPDMLTAAARLAASVAREDAGGALGGALVFDCVSRYEMLGDRMGEELAMCHGALGADVPLLGCLTAGEVGAFGPRMPQFHNKTMVVLALPARS